MRRAYKQLYKPHKHELAGLSLVKHLNIRRRTFMFKSQSSESMLKSYPLFFIWFFLHAILLLTCNVLAGFTLLAQGDENSLNLIGLISGGFIGLFIGFVQWLILRRYFSISLLWIISCVIDFGVYYAVNWYSGAILMGVFQQLLLRNKVNDSFLWFTISFISIGVSGLLLLRPETLCLYGAAYGLPTAGLLAWYQDKSSSKRVNETPIENV